ncbi:Cytochrome c551 peroxidase [Campylobacter concisus UNSW1]|nr:Cytochrome c551 peroxidase [Campylobacter concisus UNSW1]
MLGKKLFFDKRLSPNENYSCQTCHNLYWNLSGSNQSSTEKGMLNPPSILNAAANYLFYNDAKKTNLKDQVKESITSRIELNSNNDKVVDTVNSISEYKILFKEIYEDGISLNNIIDAIVEFEKAVLSIDSPFDHFISGDDNAISDEAKKGFDIFNKIGCVACHNGRNLGGNLMQDLGHNKISALDTNKRLRRAPSLRNIAKTAPYLSHGEMSDLKETLRYVSYYQLGHELSKDEMDALYAFLLTLNGKRPRILNEY